uniref:Macaca fascicularis brain cDNA clone: QflA-22278, similar to human chromosome 9 open reading frame 90 (C9orf90), mRNA, RefSeq: NM_197956.1 n=1 Tax=Macaca fascicularis TaxID=9541 RepID=I7G7A0_MACFA|nr:unnamed protein product [Macaca fascicularis]
MPLHSSLGDRARLSQKTTKKKRSLVKLWSVSSQNSRPPSLFHIKFTFVLAAVQKI